MEPESSLPHSQESATCPCPGPAQSSPHTHLLEIHPNIIHPSTPRSPQWSLSLQFPHQDPIRPPILTHTRHMPSPSHSSRFYHPHNIGWGVQIIKLLVTQSPPFSRYLVPPTSKYSPQQHILKHPQLPFLSQCQRPSLYIYIYNLKKFIVNYKGTLKITFQAAEEM